jgi:hypothetical protein
VQMVLGVFDTFLRTCDLLPDPTTLVSCLLEGQTNKTLLD